MASSVTEREHYPASYCGEESCSCGDFCAVCGEEWLCPTALATVEGLLANQAFGQVIGARALRGEANYRVQSLTTTPNNVQYILEMDTLISDFDSAYGTMSISQFNDTFDGYRFVDFTNRSLAFGDS